jgi:hypothetical protein
MLWVVATFQVLFDLVVVFFLLASLRRKEPATVMVESTPVWHEEVLSTLDQLLHALNEKLPHRASLPEVIGGEERLFEEHKGARRERGQLPGERLLISSLAEKRERAGRGLRKIG